MLRPPLLTRPSPWRLTMTATITTIDEFRAAFPVGRDATTGRWGWRRQAGCLNLNACGFRSRRVAEADRDSHLAAYLACPSDFSR